MKKNFIFISNTVADDSFMLNLLSSSMTPMYLFETHENGLKNFETHERYRNYSINELHLSRPNNPATSAVIAISSNTNLSMILEGMRNSIWWNPEALFLIVNKNLANGCNMAELFLKTVWAFNILSAIYMCYNLKNQAMLYTFNPYNNLAPKFWNKRECDYFSNEYWTMFQHSLEFASFLETLSDDSKYISSLRNYNNLFIIN